MKAEQFIDIIAPEHGRTSCHDGHLDNSFYFDEDKETQERSRCVRCSLLKILELNGDLPEYFEPNKIFFR